MSTSIDGMFAGLDDFYPGSRQRRITKTAAPDGGPGVVGSDAGAWDLKPVTKTIHGKQVEMFTIGALAKALGKAEGTIRNYQDKGYLPNTPYRLPTREVNGKPRAGRRLFTRSMIEAAVQAFDARGLVHVKRIEWRDHTDLPDEVALAWRTIQQSITK